MSKPEIKKMNKLKFLSLSAILVFSMHSLSAQKQKEHGGKQNDNNKADANQAALNIVDTAKTLLGVKYKPAGRSPEIGFDCSGFVYYVYKQNGYKVPVISRDYLSVGKKIKKKNCKPGDIILFAGRNQKTNPIGHVGIVIQRTDTEILFIHSASSANRGIVISRLSFGYYKKRFAGIRRVQYDIN